MSKEDKYYTVSLTLSVCASDEEEAWKEFEKRVQAEDFDSDSIDIEEEDSSLYE
jgi:hypothetical protein